MNVLVTGGAGFVGSHLIDRLMDEGHEVICVDSFFSGRRENIAHHLGKENFTLLVHDVRKPLKWEGGLDRIYHLACPASPVQYQFDPVLTLETSILGTQNMLALARKKGARLLYTSTSEAYGDPLEHPQKETYWGNVDPLGKRACYDEGKRAAETLCKDYVEQYGVDARIVRIFNTYGPRMMFNDGRVLSNFILQSLLGEDITVHGDGSQTRSFMFVTDLIEGLVKRMEIQSSDWRPVNLGNPDERTIGAVALSVKNATGSGSRIVSLAYEKIPERLGDPKQRCADISRAKDLLTWEPVVGFDQGLATTIADFKDRLRHKPRILVFAPVYLPYKGPAEEAVSEIIARSPGYEFDIVTAKLDPRFKAESELDRVHIYRLGRGTKWDKLLLPLRAAKYARKLHKKHTYHVAWAVMASYGALAASLFSLVSNVPFLLSVYEGNIDEKMLERGAYLSPLYRFMFRRAHRWQVVGAMSQMQQAWLEDDRDVQAVQLDGDWDKLAKKTKEMFSEVEILSTRL
ncbi:MAG: hypothetical protein COU35_03995 [Candidatus Magasanikbacteria bacterium CG10_big_fil_rev_8_21_14_0_10_47_10]|uniref:NAD-dependent epimerase/dehydratase domain-containing protein n=1 Tax=Candidatus Magasanikbacteria bacterium CG10_big_fil_rev_8_21_14_0_10_47_10 TaxID=1974652 RepID=A0A2H0TPV4_9BACT|nr:MAG: hypothetical protein COU35_03995 [Candidatus Magasanikbacteria bacterium CG10_big_fil_rev_8_21_14_0_10_47_10]